MRGGERKTEREREIWRDRENYGAIDWQLERASKRPDGELKVRLIDRYVDR